MQFRKYLITLLVIPALALAGCSGVALSLNSANTQAAAALPNQVTVSPSTSSSTGSSTVASTSPSSSSALASGDPVALQNMYEQIYAKVNPSVVSIQVIEGSQSVSTGNQGSGLPFGFTNPNQRSPQTQSQSVALGSGIIWDTQGDIVTNNHVVSGASQITVTFADGTSVDAKVVGTDPNSDLAVIKVSAPASELVPVSVGNSDLVKVGQIAIAIGNPYGEANTMTAGIISALDRNLPVTSNSLTSSSGAQYAIPDIIQTDAPINPGNSGGVLVDINGQLIGVTSAIESSSQSNSGIGFVIPSNIVQKVASSIVKTGAYNHPWLGISGTTLTPDLATAMGLNAQQQGALVVDVVSGGPAAKAGLQASTQNTTVSGQQVSVGGDVITAINGQPITKFDDLSTYLLTNTEAGQNVTLTILRQGKEQTVQVTLGTLPSN